MDNIDVKSEETDEMELRRGPWTLQEDLTLINYISNHGHGRWNSLARFAGLKRTGKSCRLRWLNYLRPDVRRGNITLEEQLLILELHSRLGNRWSKIAEHLHGRTDNEIKNYWRTRVQKHAKQLKCDVNSKQFKDTMRYLWMPRLVERIQANNNNSNNNNNNTTVANCATSDYTAAENSGTAASSDSSAAQVPPVSDLTDYYIPASLNPNPDSYFIQAMEGDEFSCSETLISPGWYAQGLDIPATEQSSFNQWMAGGDTPDSIWNADDDVLFLQQQFNYHNV